MMTRRGHTSKALRYGTCSQGISQFYLHTRRSFTNRMNHICLFLPSQSLSSFTDCGGMESWVGPGGWLHTKINVWHRELNLDTVTHSHIITCVPAVLYKAGIGISGVCVSVCQSVGFVSVHAKTERHYW